MEDRLLGSLFRSRVHSTQVALVKRDHSLKKSLKNDNLKLLSNDWNECMLELTEYVDDGMLATLFRNQVNLSSLTAPYLQQYDWEDLRRASRMITKSCSIWFARCQTESYFSRTI